jgi:hypothetical protein
VPRRRPKTRAYPGLGSRPRAPLIRSASLPGALREVNSKGVDGWAGGFGHKQCPKTRGSLRADAETTSQTATRRLPASLIHMNARMCACMHSQLHTKVPDLTSDDTGSPPYGVCHHPLVNSARYSSRVPVVPALARAPPARAAASLSASLHIELPPCGRSRVAASPVLRVERWLLRMLPDFATYFCD